MRKVNDKSSYQAEAVQSSKPASSAATTGGTGASSSNSNSMNPVSIFRNMALGSGAGKAAAPAVVLSEEEKQLRRERLSAAAQDRSKTWDKKLGQKKKPSTSSMEITDANAGPGDEESTHAETERAIRKTKELEVKIEQV